LIKSYSKEDIITTDLEFPVHQILSSTNVLKNDEKNDFCKPNQHIKMN